MRPGRERERQAIALAAIIPAGQRQRRRDPDRGKNRHRFSRAGLQAQHGRGGRDQLQRSGVEQDDQNALVAGSLPVGSAFLKLLHRPDSGRSRRRAQPQQIGGKVYADRLRGGRILFDAGEQPRDNGGKEVGEGF